MDTINMRDQNNGNSLFGLSRIDNPLNLKKKKFNLFIIFAIVFVLGLATMGNSAAADNTTVMTGNWTGSGGTYNSTAGPINVTATVTTTGNAAWGNVTTGTTNTDGSFFSNASAANHASLEADYWYDTNPDTFHVFNDAGTGTITFTFSEPITNPILYIDRIGGVTASGRSTSAIFTLTTAGLTLSQLSGCDHLDVTSTTFQRTVNQKTSGRESNWDYRYGTAAGSIMIIGNNITQVTFTWTQAGNGDDGAGADSLELIWGFQTRANIKLTQTANSPVNVGDKVTYLVNATNIGPNTATHIKISDVIPAALGSVTVTPSVGTYDMATGIWTIPKLAKNDSATLNITGTATAAMAGFNTTNTATKIGQNDYDEDSTNDACSAKVYTKKADVSLSQTVNGASSGSVSVNVGDKLTYLITATNNGPDSATLINIRDLVPNGLTGVTITPSVGNYNSTTGVWSIPSLASGVSATLNITGTVGPSMAGNNTTNTATVISQVEYDPTVPSSTSIPAYTNKANVVLSQTVNSPVNVGDTVKYVVTALNNGPDTATNVLIHDLIPALAGVVVTPSVGTYNSTSGVWIIPSLASGVSATLNITGTATAAMAGTNTTNTATQTGQTEYNEAYTTANAATYTKLASVSVTNTASSGSLNVGDTGYFTVTVTNNGPDTVTNINITDRINGWIPDHATVTAGTYNPVTGVWTIPSLAPGASATWTFSAVVPSYVAGTNVTNVVTEVQSEYPLSVDVANATIYVKKANVVLSQTVNSPVNVGNTVSYIVTALNNGPDAATNINILDVIPAGLAGVVVTPSVGNYDMGTGVWTIPSLASGAVASLNITGTATAAMAGNNTTNTATQTGQTEYSDEYTAVSAAVYTKKADVTVTNTANSGALNVGDTGVFTVSVTNGGPDTVTNVVVTDLLPGFTGSVSVGSYDPVTGVWTIPSLAPGASATLTLSGVITAGMAGTNVTNVVTEVQSEYPLSVVVPDAMIYVKKADVVLTQTGSYSKNNVTFIVTATNNGPDSATEINIRDMIPNGLTNVIVTPSVGTYNAGTGIWYIPVLANGTSATLNITGVATPQSTLINSANRTYQEEYNSQTSNSIKSIYIPSADVRVNVYTSTGKYTNWDVNNDVTWVADLINNGPDDAYNVVATISLPDGLVLMGVDTRSNGNYTYDSVNRIITWYLGFMPSGGAASLDFLTYINKSGNLTVTMTKTNQSEYDSNTANNIRSRTLPIPQQVDIQVNQNVNGSTFNQVNVGDIITIDINIQNNGDNAAGLTIMDLLPAGLTFVSADTYGVGTYDNNTGIWNIGNFNSKENATLSIIVIVNNASVNNTIINTVKLETKDQFDWNFNNNAKNTYLSVIERD